MLLSLYSTEENTTYCNSNQVKFAFLYENFYFNIATAINFKGS